MQRRATLTGSTLRPRQRRRKGGDCPRAGGARLAAARGGQGLARLHAVFPLERAADAHRALESGEVIGKVVLTT